MILKKADPSKVWIIDSDGELPKNFFMKFPVRGVVTYFYYAQDFYRESQYDPVPNTVVTIPPILTERLKKRAKPLEPIFFDLFFVGNYGLKQKKLPEWLEKLNEDGLRVAVQGKWPNRFGFRIFQRTERKKAYELFERSLSSVQISKEKYRNYSFLSPRIYETLAVGGFCFIEEGYVCQTPFSSVSNYIEFREKVLTLKEGFDRDFEPARTELIQKLEEIEGSLF